MQDMYIYVGTWEFKKHTLALGTTHDTQAGTFLYTTRHVQYGPWLLNGRPDL
jgi:hypothetical protein